MKKILLIALLFMSSNAFAEQAGDATAGAKVFNKCKVCHSFGKGQKNKVGPNLWNIVNRPIASAEGFNYSQAFQAKKSEVVWDEETLDVYLTKPRDFIAKSKMAFVGLKKGQDRADLIAYLKTLSDAEGQ